MLDRPLAITAGHSARSRRSVRSNRHDSPVQGLATLAVVTLMQSGIAATGAYADYASCKARCQGDATYCHKRCVKR